MNKFELAEKTAQQRINEFRKKLEDAIKSEDYQQASVYNAYVNGMEQILKIFQTTMGE